MVPVSVRVGLTCKKHGSSQLVFASGKKNGVQVGYFSGRVRKFWPVLPCLNRININLHSYCNNFANLHIFNLNNVSDFGNWTCKIDTFLYFVLINPNALQSRIGGGKKDYGSLFFSLHSTLNTGDLTQRQPI